MEWRRATDGELTRLWSIQSVGTGLGSQLTLTLAPQGGFNPGFGRVLVLDAESYAWLFEAARGRYLIITNGDVPIVAKVDDQGICLVRASRP